MLDRLSLVSPRGGFSYFISSGRLVNFRLFLIAFRVPLARSLPGGVAISSDPAGLSKSAFPTHTQSPGTAKPDRKI
ncbi:hypothetical protein [Actinomadura sp. CNU-125]|uniref:hypothetical protein n=1 Tax=Actinomadura sp. CNU-125 TaxID=1904961 RepID=UPI0011777E24|nr:hypothetical protein [Actinomadura sp. CNU-125]